MIGQYRILILNVLAMLFLTYPNNVPQKVLGGPIGGDFPIPAVE